MGTEAAFPFADEEPESLIPGFCKLKVEVIETSQEPQNTYEKGDTNKTSVPGVEAQMQQSVKFLLLSF
ncbi:hypothetical protein Nepgr_006278 [Nepenthes gracilis]|uniref:Uncharacterized protein n=1 Tax=Nepenthes gracilis TaxID=150966 RepID=A0AAD3XH71_NEPGR|nr:hypothetical protein Nepgr_006278 [Nepenthes gracilis]